MWSLLARRARARCASSHWSSACGVCSRLGFCKAPETGGCGVCSRFRMQENGARVRICVPEERLLPVGRRCGVESRYTLAMAGRDGRRITPRSLMPTRASG
jgi:hypothetical protein